MKLRSTVAILVLTCLAASRGSAAELSSDTAPLGETGTLSERELIAQAVLDMPAFDDVFSSELVAERLPFCVVGLPSEFRLRKAGREVAVVSMEEARTRAIGYVVFEKIDMSAGRARVVLGHPEKDLTLFIDAVKQRGAWKVKTYRMEQR